MKAYKTLCAGAALLLACSCTSQKQEIGELSQAAAAATEISEIAEENPQETIASASRLLSCNFFDDASFIMWDNKAKDYPSDKAILAGVVPHHLTAGQLISGFFRAASKSREEVETVVIIATSHYEGRNTLYTTFSDWASPFGTVETDRDIAEAFCDKLGAVTDDERLEADHAAASHIPFVKHYFPEAKAACLLVAPSYDMKTPQRIAEALDSLPEKEKYLFLFSIDFSHYLTPEEADSRDMITRKAVEDKDYRRIEGFKNDNVDSPFCLSAYLRLSELLGGEVTEADNSNTMKIIGTPYSKEVYTEGVTSYFVYITS